MIRFPFPFTFDPPPQQAGGPGIVNRGRPERGTRDLALTSAPGNPSSARLLTSFGMDVGFPRDDRGRRLTDGVIELVAAPILDFNTFFYTGGTFASALTSGIVSVFVEEFDAAGRFTRGINGQELVIVRDEPPWIAGSSQSAPSGRSITIPDRADRPIRVRAGMQYRLWVDLTGEIRAAGHGGFGGSSAIAQVWMRLQSVDFLWLVVG